MCINSFDLLSNDSESLFKAGIRWVSIAYRAAMWIVVGITSFDDCPKFTWSLG